MTAASGSRRGTTLRAPLPSMWRSSRQTCSATRSARRDPDAAVTPFLDLSSGYVQRAVDRFPKQGTESPWLVRQNYFADFRLLRLGRVDDPALEFSPAGAPRGA